MSEHYSDQELRDLFQNRLPPVTLPIEAAAEVRQRVLAEVAATYRRTDEYVRLPDVEPVVHPLAAAGGRATRPRRESGIGEFLKRFRLVGSLSLAGATVAALLLFFLFVREVLPPITAPGGITGSSPETLPVLESITPAPLQAVINIADGNATLLRKSTGQTEDLAPGSVAEMRAGDELITLSASARIQFFENQSTFVEPNTRVELISLFAENDSTEVVLMVRIGATRHEINGALGTDDLFEVHSPSAKASAVGTDFIVATQSATTTYFATFAGAILVEMGGELSAVTAGEEVTAVDGQPLVVQNISPDAQDIVASARLDDVETEPTATATAEPTATPTEEPAATAEPTATAEATATATLEQPTATAEATATGTPEATATATRAPTSTPTATTVPLLVQLVTPNDRVGGSGEVLFQWSADRVLDPEHAFELILWKEGQDPLTQGFGIAAPTRRTRVIVDLDLLDDRLGALLDAGEYYWGVREVSVDPYERLQFLGDTRLFRFDGKQSSAPATSGE